LFGPSRIGLLRRVFITQTGDGTDHAELIAALRELRHQLADFHPRHIGRDRLEFAAEFFRRFRFQVERVHVSRTAGQIDIDDRLAGGPRAGKRFGPQKFRQRQPAERESADGEEVTPGDAVTERALIPIREDMLSTVPPFSLIGGDNKSRSADW
jgi:hypothetical protein